MIIYEFLCTNRNRKDKFMEFLTCNRPLSIGIWEFKSRSVALNYCFKI